MQNRCNYNKRCCTLIGQVTLQTGRQTCRRNRPHRKMMLPVSKLLSAAVLQVIMFLSTDAEQLLGKIDQQTQ